MDNQSDDDRNQELINCLIDSKDERRRTALLREIETKFRKIAYVKRIPEKDRDDVVNSGLEKVFSKITSYSGKGKFDHWVCTVFANHCFDYFRKMQREKVVDIGREISESESSVEFDLQKIFVHRQRLEKVNSIIVDVITKTSKLRRHKQRDAEIARLGLVELLEPQEIYQSIEGQYPAVSINAIRIVLHVFRNALKCALDGDQKGDDS